MRSKLEEKLLNLKKGMLEDLQKAWEGVVSLNISDKKTYYYEGQVNTALKYYKILFGVDLCKDSKAAGQILDIGKVQVELKKVIEVIRGKTSY